MMSFTFQAAILELIHQHNKKNNNWLFAILQFLFKKYHDGVLEHLLWNFRPHD